MLVALTLAAGQPHALRTLLLGYAVLAPFVTWGLIAEFLKHIVFDAGPGVASQTGFTSAQREVIAFAYQFGAPPPKLRTVNPKGRENDLVLHVAGT